MAENNVAVQAESPQLKLLLNGVEATAQQVYDALMAGPVRLTSGRSGNVSFPITFYWENSDGKQTNPKAITYVEIYCAKPGSNNTTVWITIPVGTRHIE